ncbi:MAG: accessory factor UbiK family protein [Gammaproteobacteria bacterium]
MIDSPKIDDLTERLSRIFPAGEQLREDLRKNFRAVLNACLARMDLVTREEFDVQSRVLARTRVRLEATEKEIERLEAQFKHGKNSPAD